MLEYLKRLPAKIRHNGWLKLLSLVLAFVVWVVVVAYYNPETTNLVENVPITVDAGTNLQERGLILVSELPATLDVRIEGRREKIALVGKDKITAVVSTAAVTKAGEYDLPVNVAIDGQMVTTVSQSIQTARLVFEKIAVRQIAVDVIAKGAVAEGSVLEKVANPTVVTVTGPKSVVDKISAIQAVISQDNFTESGVYDATLLYLDEKGEKLADDYLTADAVKVNISVLSEKTVPLKVELINSAGGNDALYLTAAIEPETVTVAASAEALESINHISLGSLDVAEIKNGQSSELSLILPNDVKSAEAIEKAKVTVNLEGTVTKQFDLSAAGIRFENVVSGTKIETPAGRLKVTVRGNAADLEKLRAEDISLHIDCKNEPLPRGNNRLSIYCVFPEDYKVGAIGRYQITVKVS